MSSDTPTIRQVSLIGSIPQVLVMITFVIVGNRIDPRDGFIWGLGMFFALRFALRAVPRDHRAAMALVRQNRFADAIPCFQKSLNFFGRHPWLDQYRSVVLLSPSGISYQEMAMANIAFCYSQIGDGKSARLHYQQCLERFPDSGIALTALRMMDSVSENPATETGLQ